jgi:hypothetical protein
VDPSQESRAYETRALELAIQETLGEEALRYSRGI